MEKLQIPAKKYSVNEQSAIKLTKEAHQALVDVVNESTSNLKQVASAMILYVIKNNLYEYIREE